MHHRDTELVSFSLATCAAEGVMAPLVGIVGSIQATETIKLIIGSGEVLCGRLLLVDTLAMEFQSVTLRRNPECPDCATRPGD